MHLTDESKIGPSLGCLYQGANVRTVGRYKHESLYVHVVIYLTLHLRHRVTQHQYNTSSSSDALTPPT